MAYNKTRGKGITMLETRPISDLIVLAIFRIGERGEKASFKNLVKECFGLWPKAFGLRNYTRWPDTRKLDSALRKLRAKKILVGKPSTFFFLTGRGRIKAQEIVKSLRQKKLL